MRLGELGELESREVAVQGMSCRVVRRTPGAEASGEFLMAAEQVQHFWNVLQEVTKKYGGEPVGYQALSSLRLEQGIPWFGYDFGEKQIPHEAGLEHSHISYTKGCYTGQEIVERVRSRGQVNRRRVRLRFSTNEPPVPLTRLRSKDAEAKELGIVTSSAFSPAAGAAVGMGYVRREQNSPGSVLDCDGGVLVTCPMNQACDLSTGQCSDGCTAAINNKQSIGCEYYATAMDSNYSDYCFAEFIGNNNLFQGRIRSRSGSIVFVDSLDQLLYVKVPASIKHVPIGKDVWFSVRADLMNTGDKQDMANRIEGKYIASEFLGSLETDVFEVAPGQYVHVEQHRHAQDHVYKMGDRETLCWHAESGVLLENSRLPEDVEAA